MKLAGAYARLACDQMTKSSRHVASEPTELFGR